MSSSFQNRNQMLSRMISSASSWCGLCVKNGGTCRQPPSRNWWFWPITHLWVVFFYEITCFRHILTQKSILKKNPKYFKKFSKLNYLRQSLLVWSVNPINISAFIWAFPPYDYSPRRSRVHILKGGFYYCAATPIEI